MNRFTKSISIIIIILFLSIPANAAYNALMFPKFKWDNYETGAAASGWKVNCYANGTTTRKTSYSTPTGTANTNPVVLNTHGEADIYLDGVYTIVLTDDSDVVQWTLNDVEGAAISQIVVSIAATLAAIGTGSTDGDLIMIAATTNNFYTWDDDNSKWRVKSGGIFTTAALPASATYTIETGTTCFDTTTSTQKWWDGSAWVAIKSISILQIQVFI